MVTTADGGLVLTASEHERLAEKVLRANLERDFLLWLVTHPRDTGRSSLALAVHALRCEVGTRRPQDEPMASPGDDDDYARCARVYFEAPYHLRAAMNPWMAVWRQRLDVVAARAAPSEAPAPDAAKAW